MKHLLLVAAQVLWAGSSFAQRQVSPLNQPAWDKGYKVLNTGVSLGYSGYSFPGRRVGFSVPVQVSLDFGLSDVLSVGGVASFSTYDNETSLGNFNTSMVVLGGRGVFHITESLNDIIDGKGLDATRLDLYIGLMGGVEIRSVVEDNAFITAPDDDGVRAVWGPFFGARYLFTERVGLFAEGGKTALGLATVGVSFSL